MSSPKENIIILGSGKFDGEYPSTIFTLAKQFAQRYRVFYVDYPYTLTDCIKFRKTDQYKIRKPHFRSSADGIIDTDLPDLKVVITPPVLSINFLPEGRVYRNLLKINEAIIAKRINQVRKKFAIKEFVYINSFNFHYPDISKLISPSLSIYHSVDPLIIPYDMRHGLVSERRLIEESDLVVCTSKQLYNEHLKINPRTYFIPNAADLNQSKKALNPDLPVHEKIKDIKKPVVGFVGHIERRMDFDLLKEVTEKNREKSFVFVGPQSPEFLPHWFTNSPNIHLVGKVPFEDLPSVYKGLDVALIPFKKDEVSATIFPLKLFEYLGAGKPVVSTDFNPDLKGWTDGTVAYCHSAEAFSEAINTYLEEEGPEMIPKRLEVAANNTWEKRAEEFSSLFYLNKKVNEDKKAVISQ